MQYLDTLEISAESAAVPECFASELAPQPVTPKQAAVLVDGYLAGKSTKQLAAEYARSRATISAMLKRAEVEIRTFRASIPENIWEMITLYRSELSLIEVAERVGFPEKTVFTKLKRAGVKLRGPHGE